MGSEMCIRDRLTSGGGRTPISIPKGVSSSVASLLQQINAASSGPVLTLDIDESSNSLIVRAPPELRLEIREFLNTIDTQASTNSNRHVKVTSEPNKIGSHAGGFAAIFGAARLRQHHLKNKFQEVTVGFGVPCPPHGRLPNQPVSMTEV